MSDIININENDLVIERIFNSKVENVWDSWTKPELMVQWWGPKNFTAPVCKINFRVEGKYLCCMRDPNGNNYWSTGIYLEITKSEKIICTDSFADENGNVIHASYYGMIGDFPMELLVSISFKTIDGKTKMTLVHTGFPPGEMVSLCRQGWEESFDKLEILLDTL